MPISYLNQSVLKKWRGKTCILRADLDIKSGEEHISLRISAILPTIHLLLKHEIKVVLMGHRGRPTTRKSALSLKPFAKLLAKKLKRKITFIPHFNFPRIQKQIQKSKNHVFLLENLRFLPAERKDNTRLAKTLASLGDFFINDSFAESHRKHTSVSAITRFLPSYAGLHLEIEIQRLTYVMKHFKRPLTIILGGIKISSKIGVIRYFWRKADQFLLGGGPANTFFAAQGLPIGNSIFEPHAVPFIKNFIDSDKIKLPIDLNIKSAGQQSQILDIGPKTIKKYGEIIKHSKTIIWSGPVGLFEKKEFRKGTEGIWKAVLSAGRRNKKVLIVVGGGETTTSLKFLQPITHNLPPNIFLSTGGGAMLEYLSGKKLPGIEALKKQT